jgi:hypothetical protein
LERQYVLFSAGATGKNAWDGREAHWKIGYQEIFNSQLTTQLRLVLACVIGHAAFVRRRRRHMGCQEYLDPPFFSQV